MASGSITSASIQTLKMVLMSAGVLFIGILLSLSLPHLLNSATSSDLIPSLWSSLRSWLRPPYLYVIINGIIITIAATSRLHHYHHQAPPSESSPYDPPKVISPSPLHHSDVISIRADHHHQLLSPYDAVSVTEVVSNANSNSYYSAVSVKDVEVEVVGSRFEEEREKRIVEENTPIEEEEKEVLSTVDEMSTWTPPAPLRRQRPVDELLTSQQKPPPSLRFGHHRKPAKVSSAEGGKALRRVAKPKKHDTLESSWKAITEKKHMPLTRHVKKSDAWENHSRQINLLDDDLTGPALVKKSETFKDRTNYSPPLVPAPKLKKEPSLSQDELNRRVEAFINKFNEEMRLQRQQSIQQFMEKINRAA